MVKVTFTLDDETVDRLRRTASRLGRAQSQIVREAVAEYAARADRLSEGERRHLLGVLQGLQAASPTRPASAVDRELRDVRSARRRGGRRSG